MSASAFIGPFARRSRRGRTADAAPSGAVTSMTESRVDVHARHRASRWLGDEGEQLRLRVRVEEMRHDAGRSLVLTARVEETGDLVEWSMPRRHRIRVGDRLALSGIVKAHTTQNNTRVTLLRDCFNPMRMT